MAHRRGYSASSGGYSSGHMSDYAGQVRIRKENSQRIRDQRKMRMEREAAQRGYGDMEAGARERRRVPIQSHGYPMGQGGSRSRSEGRGYSPAFEAEGRRDDARQGYPPPQPNDMQQPQHLAGRSQGHGSVSRVQSADTNNVRERQLLKRIQSLEEQLKLVRHQQRLFISFMQTANQKFMAIDSGLKEAIAAAAESATQSATKAQAQMYSKPMEASNQYYDYDVRESADISGRSPPPPGGPSQHPESQPRSGNSSARRWQDASEYAQRVEREQKSAATHAKSKNFRAKSSRVEARSESKRGSGAAAGSEVGFGDMDYGYNQKFGDEEGDDDVDNHSDDLGGPYANQTYQEPAQTAPGITVSNDYAGSEDEDGPDPYAEEPVQLDPCVYCGRKFKPDVLKRHVEKKVCQKTRRKFSVKRVEEKVKKDKRSDRRYQAIKKQKKEKPKWKKDREALREAMRQGRLIKKALKEGKDLRDLPPMPSQPVEDDRTPCPHCGRRFNADVAERHIPRCKNIRAKPKRLVSKRQAYGGVRKGSRR
ncbi:hypothetical protein AAMO2058_000693400 [Amorphochlora amoebiformis]